MAFLNAMTVDVEDYFHVQAFANVIGRGDWERYPSRVERNTLRLLEIFARMEVRATFFVLGWVAERFPGLVQAVCKAGHRVGCHGYEHRMIYEGNETDFRIDVRHAKQIIEDITGIPVTSFRAPSYSITSQTPWAFEVLGEEGFEYDSSIFPIIHDNYGISDAPRFPYVRQLKCGRQIREFPPSTLRLLGSNVPVAGGGYLRLFPYKLTAWAIHRLNTTERQPAMVYLHPWEIDPDQPRVSASWFSRFRHYNNLDSTETKCLKLLEEFSWAPMEEVLSQGPAQQL
jgi:polysaccharide deacetylase family protein (PEP-CTERM system associated)